MFFLFTFVSYSKANELGHKQRFKSILSDTGFWALFIVIEIVVPLMLFLLDFTGVISWQVLRWIFYTGTQYVSILLYLMVLGGIIAFISVINQKMVSGGFDEQEEE